MKYGLHKFLSKARLLALAALAATLTLAAPAMAQSLVGTSDEGAPSLTQPFAPVSPEGDAAPTAPTHSYAAVKLTTMPAPIVVELFTAEGCASCPPADDLLGELRNRQYVLPLSYHVDYWDYIGWKDRFADPAFTRRQKAYAAAQGNSMVYTPQMIVAGAIDVVGSDRAEVDKALKTAYTRNSMYRIQVMREDDGKVVAQFPEAPIGVPATIWLVTYTRNAESQVKDGENAGQNLKSYNVVRSLQKVGVWTGAATEIELKLDAAAMANSPDACAIIANQAEHGPIVAAAGFQFDNAW